MLRLEINPPKGAGPGAQYVADWKPVELDPFPQLEGGPVMQKGATGTGQPVGAPETAWKALELDPFEAGPQPSLEPAPLPAAPQAPSYPYTQGTEKSASWVSQPAWLPGLLPGSSTTATLQPTEVPAEEPGPPMGSRSGTPAEKPAPYTGEISVAGRLIRNYLGLPELKQPWAQRALNADTQAQTIDAAPPGTGTVPDLDYTGPANIERTRKRVEATPPEQPGWGSDGTNLNNAPKGSLGYDTHGDVYGGQASNMALLKASLIPLTSRENLEKRIAILAADVGVSPDRFFVKDGQIKYVDYAGRSFNTAPSSEGGTWKAPIDKLSRIAGEQAKEAGQTGVQIAGLTGGLLAGPENYGPSAVAAAGAAAALADVFRQMAGNELAQRSGYKPPPGTPPLDLDLWNVVGQAAQNMGYEAFARFLPLFLSQLAPNGIFGNNPYRLSGTEAQDLARILHDDLQHGGKILERARITTELGLPLTPRDLLQVTEGIGGHTSADVTGLRGRLFESLSQHENTLASLRGKKGALAADKMRQFYIYRARHLFPQAVTKLLDRISTVESPALAFELFKDASGRVVQFLEKARLAAGHKAGWGSLFSSPVQANPIPAIRMIESRIANAAGETRAALTKLRKELVDTEAHTTKGGQVNREVQVTGYQRLHQVRLHLERQIEALKSGKSSAEQTELLNELEGIHDVLRNELNNHPLYRTGDTAYTEASARLADARKGIVALGRRDPLHQERQGGALADSGPTVIRAARELFEAAGEKAAWDAHTRGYLQTHLRTAGGAGGMQTAAQGGTHQPGLNFANEVAGQPHLRAGLMEMVDEAHRPYLEGVIDGGFAIDQANRGLGRIADEAVKPNLRRLNPTGTNLWGKAAGLLTPIQGLIRRAREMQEGIDMRGAYGQAIDLSHFPSMKHYKEMTDTTVPLGGHRAEVFERGLYAGAPVVQDQTDWIPRPSPAWLIKMGLPVIAPPPERDPTAPDLKIPRSRLLQLLGPAER